MTTHGAADSTGTAAADPDEAPQGGDSGVVGNERLTALAGVLLLVLIVAEIATVLTLRTLMSVHILVGVLMVGPLAVKLGSTGYRFVRYYTRSAAYVRRGPPARPLRLLAPLLVVTTVVLVASGIGLVVTGPAEPGPLLPLHNVTFLVWLPLIAIHAVAYLAHALRLTAADSSEPRATSRLGRGPRLVTNGASLLLGAIGALLLFPVRRGTPGVRRLNRSRRRSSSGPCSRSSCCWLRDPAVGPIGPVARIVRRTPGSSRRATPRPVRCR